MLRNRYVIGGGIIALLILANIISYIWSNWGLITVKVTDAPLGQVIKSIERQGWVTIYTDMPADTKVSMWVDHVPLPEALESLTANVGGQWHLGFFAAPTSAGVKQEILAFQSGNVGDDTKTYSYPTPMALLSSGSDDNDLPASDPYKQVWPGYHAPPAPPVPPADPNNPTASAQPAPTPDAPPTTLQDYLKAVAREADVWIMAPGSWAPTVPAPSANSSISHAVKSLVGSAHGAVQQAIVLRGRQQRRGPGGGGGQRGGGFGGGDTGWASMEDRMRNVINGLPSDVQPGATAQLEQEIKFQQDVQAAPPDQRMTMMRQHFQNRMGQNNWRRSPDKRAQMYQRAVSNRQTARGQ
jgi:hypothetical protein